MSVPRPKSSSVNGLLFYEVASHWHLLTYLYRCSRLLDWEDWSAWQHDMWKLKKKERKKDWARLCLRRFTHRQSLLHNVIFPDVGGDEVGFLTAQAHLTVLWCLNSSFFFCGVMVSLRYLTLFNLTAPNVSHCCSSAPCPHFPLAASLPRSAFRPSPLPFHLRHLFRLHHQVGSWPNNQVIRTLEAE